MNKTALGFGIGLVIIAAGAIGYLALSGPGEPAAAPAIEQAPATPEVAAAPAAEPEPIPVPDTPAPKIPQPAVVRPTSLTLTRTIPDAADFANKETIDVNVRIEQAAGNDPVRAMGMQEQIPAGFTLVEFDGPRKPDVRPPAGARGTLEFAWFQFADGFFPAEFTYRLKKDGDAAESPQISGQVLYRTSGEELRTDVVTSLLGTGAATAAQSTPAAEAAPAPEAMPAEATAEVAPLPTPAQIFLARGALVPAYAPGQPLDVEVVLEREGDAPVSAVAVVDSLPPGWTFEGIKGGTAPPIKPAAGTKGNLSFIFIEVPEFPIKFTYTVKPAEDSTGEQAIRGKVAYRSENSPLEGTEVVTAIPQQ